MILALESEKGERKSKGEEKKMKNSQKGLNRRCKKKTRKEEERKNID